MTAIDIQKLLQAKHSEDVYVSECKTGPTYPGYMRLDGWAMKRSWASPMVTGYEIKVSRSDFLQDTKYLEYAKYCNSLFLVAPKGVAQVEELPEGVGYYQVATTGTRLFCKRKAVPRTDPIPEELYRYILMARARIISPYEQYRPETKRAFFANWLETREVNSALGSRVSKALGKCIAEEIIEVKDRNDRLKKRNENLQEVKDCAKELGIETSGHIYVNRFRNELQKRLNGSRDAVEFNLKNALESLKYLREEIAKIE